MSKILRTIVFILAAFFQILQLFNNSSAQDIEIRIRIPSSTRSAEVSGRFLKPTKSRRELVFISTYAGVTDLDKRISNVRLTDANGKVLSFHPIGASYFTEENISTWSFNIDLEPIKKTTAASHVSWIGPDGGVLTLDDMLPEDHLLLPEPDYTKRSAKVWLDLPADWKLYTTAQPLEDKAFFVQDIEKTAFVVGSRWRQKKVTSADRSINLLLSGEWAFQDDEAASLTVEVFERYLKLFGSSPKQGLQIVIHKFPFTVPPGQWEADTRGTNVTIASSDMPFKSQSLQRLHEQLRHELFHLWIPNGVDLPGDYSWFYEGFALYQSLKLGVAVNRIRFDDMLDTLSRAYNVAAASPRMSLIVASGNRWNGANTQVYASGMLVAFLCDLELLSASKGKFSSDDLLRKFYADFSGPDSRVDGTAAIIGSFYRHKELQPLVDRYITGDDEIDLRDMLSAAGIEAVTENSVTTLKVTRKPNGRQRDLLDKLGYNNWRKLEVKAK